MPALLPLSPVKHVAAGVGLSALVAKDGNASAHIRGHGLRLQLLAGGSSPCQIHDPQTPESQIRTPEPEDDFCECQKRPLLHFWQAVPALLPLSPVKHVAAGVGFSALVAKDGVNGHF